MKPAHYTRFTIEINEREYRKLGLTPMAIKEAIYKIVNPNDVRIEQYTKKEEELQ